MLRVVVCCVLLIYTFQYLPESVEGESILDVLFPRRFVYRQYPRVLYRVKNDPNQVKPNRVTRENMFGWLNPKNAVRFHLWSRKNPELAHELKVGDLESLRTSSFDSRRLTKFIIHGYQDNANEISIGDWMIFMKDSYLGLADVNVIAVDYSFYAITPFYLIPIHELVAEKLSDLIEFLSLESGADLDSIHLIGWSWGAQVSGLCGQHFKGRLGRITGLDPAGPTFKFVDNDFRLDKEDAKFVDIIHSNGGTRLIWGAHFGLRDALGHVDIYPNGGERQTGCPSEHTLNAESLLCNHGRAARYFIESIQSPLAFPMCPCDSLDNFVRDECKCPKENFAYLGEHMSRKTRGTFFLITRHVYPYGHGPHMNISLPDIPEVSNDAAVKEIMKLNRNENNLLLDFKNVSYSSVGSQLRGQSVPENDTKNFSSTDDLDKIDVAAISYRNRTMTLKFRNRYKTDSYPNEDILNLSLFAYKKFQQLLP